MVPHKFPPIPAGSGFFVMLPALISMAYEASDVDSLILFICWACINVSTYINPRFRHALPSQARLTALFALAGFTFCPGLFEVIKAATAPPLSWFESLPATVPPNAWGVYVLVFKKRGRTPLIYIGSGTAANRGLRARLYEYTKQKGSPRYVDEALSDGYRITHIALLATCPIPTAGDIPILRTLVVALEAAFSCVFWSMGSRVKSYGFGHLCPWPRDSLEWGGLCSHNPLMEAIRTGEGDLDFTPEQLEEIAAATRTKVILYGREYSRNLRANPTEKYRVTQRRNNEKQRPATKARQQAAVENKQ